MLSATLLFFDWGARGFVSNDETRFPMMARDILARGHWLFPEINGAPMLNKPPLHAWLIAIAAWPTGVVTQRTAALPSLLAAVGVIVGTFWIGRRLFDTDIGFIAGLIAVTTASVFSLARSPVPDMTLSLALIGAVGPFVLAEFGGRRGFLTLFYLMTGVAFWIKGPVGMLPLAIALAYEITTYRWSGLLRMASWPGLAILAALVGAWCGLAFGKGQTEFVQEVVIGDYVWTYFLEGSWGPERLLAPIEQAFTSLLPWSLVLPIVLWWSVRAAEPAHRRGTRFTLVWAIVVFVAVAISHRQRWRYYLPLCAPIALLLAVWFHSRRWRSQSAAFACVWLTVAVGLTAGDVALIARQDRATEWRAIAREAAKVPGPLFALDAPEIVFEFYLGRPVLRTPDYQTFAESPGARYLLVPERRVPSLLAAEHVREMADGLVAGRRFVLLKRE